MKKLPHNGSDHYAMFIHFYYNEALEDIQEEPDADSEERKQAAEKATSPVPKEWYYFEMNSMEFRAWMVNGEYRMARQE